MKRGDYFFLFLFVYFTSNSSAFGQLLVENFDYNAGQNLTDNGWTQLAAGNSITVSNLGLSYSGYASSGIGNAALLDMGESAYITFTPQSSGTIYVSFLVNVSNLTTTDDYAILHLMRQDATFFRGTVFVTKAEDNLAFGIHKSSTTSPALSTGFAYSENTTYLVVLKYILVEGRGSDEVYLFIFEEPTLPGIEPTPDLGPHSGSNDPSDIGALVLLQSSSSSANILVDGIRVSTTWNEAPLPVELTSFTYEVNGNNIMLNWLTATETNNFGFEILRKRIEEDWQKIGFVEGHGTTLQPHNYRFIDENLNKGTYSYRLKQLDTDGSFEYSSIISIEVGGPRTTQLAQNYPNPFNPFTTINYSVEAQGFVKLAIFDILGHEIRTLVEQNQSAGDYSVSWDGKNANGQAAASGIYFYSLKIQDRTEILKRMILLK